MIERQAKAPEKRNIVMLDWLKEKISAYGTLRLMIMHGREEIQTRLLRLSALKKRRENT